MKIWRLGQINETWQDFIKESKVSFDWLKHNTDYSNTDNFKKYKGWTCIKPWVEELRKGDIIFLVNKYVYSGVAVVLDNYKYKTYDFKTQKGILPGIPIKFIHHLTNPVPHNLNIKSTSPKTFYYINGIGFSLYENLKFIENKFPNDFNTIKNYLYNNLKSESDKISRVCFNSHDWKKPTGEAGKTANKKSFEYKNQFGYEEWLADKSRVLSGYHYAFLETLNSKQHKDRIYNFDLFTFIENRKYLIGKIINGICISKDESSDIYKEYKNNNWLREMSEELKDVGADQVKFNKTPKNIFFNLKFKIDDIEIFDEPKLISINDNNISTSHYKLLDKKSNFIIESNLNYSGSVKYRKTGKVVREINTTINYDSAHSKIQNELFKFLNKNGFSDIRFENNRVDITAVSNINELHFYEIKTYGSAKKSIRLAIGQLLEYAYWVKRNDVKKLIIVSDNQACSETIKYLELLKKKFNLPFYYLAFEFPNKFSKLI